MFLAHGESERTFFGRYRYQQRESGKHQQARFEYWAHVLLHLLSTVAQELEKA
jgi:hypothetical protein